MRLFSIRSLLGLSLLLLVILPAATMALFLVQRAPVAAEERASRALQDAARLGQSGSQAHLMSAYRALDGLMPETRSIVRADQALAWVSDPALFAPMAFALTRSSRDLRLVYYGSEFGVVHGVENAVGGFRFSGRGAVDSGTRSFIQQLSNDPAKPRVAEGENTDPRGQRWYQAAVQAKGRVFSAVSVDPASKQLVITLSQPAYDAAGGIAGVLGADLSLEALSEMLKGLAVSPSGVAYLVDENGILLASSTDVVPDPSAAAQSGLRLPGASASPLVRASYESLKKHWVQAPAASQALVNKVTRSHLAEAPIFVMYANVGESLGLKWKLVVAAPESNFSGSADLPADVVLLALGLLVLAGLLATSLCARHLEHQFWHMTTAVNQLANGAVPASGLPTRLREFNQLAVSVRECGRQLSESRAEALSEGFAFSDSAIEHYPRADVAGGLAPDRSAEQIDSKSPAIGTASISCGEMREPVELVRLRAQLADSAFELAVMRDRAMAATRSKAAFLAVVSHELRTPLNGVVGMTNLLCHTELSSEQQDYLQSLTLSSNQLQEVLEEVLEFSRTESGELLLQMAPFEVCDVLEAACDHAIKAAHDKGLNFVMDIPDCVQRGEALVPWIINGDAARLSQVLAHLVSNAVKFTASGTITVRVRPLDSDSSGDLPMLEVGVLDSGPGIETHQLRNVFLAFTQLDSSINRRYGGTGLGLATCKRLVELMGGHIGVESDVGVGSTFWFTALAPWAQAGVSLPAPLDTDSHEALLHPVSVSRAEQKPTILVVDDNPINLKVACAMLLKLGYPILTAEGGREAISSVAAAIDRGEKLGAVFMDVHMPDVDGIVATSTIRAAHGDRAPPIIALTTGSAVDYEQRCVDAGMVEYLSKPLKLTALAKSLERWVTPEVVVPVQAAEAFKLPEYAPADAAPELTKPAKFVRFSDADDAMPAGLVDFDRLNDFKEFDDSQLSMTREVIGLVFTEVPVLLSAIKLAILKDDAPGLISASHSLRGTASNVGAVTVQHLCGVLERDTLELQSVPPDATGCLVALRIAWNRTRPLIENWR